LFISKDIEILFMIVPTRLEQDAVEIQLAHGFRRDIMDVVREGNGLTTASAAGSASCYG
jgi:hypothetical protein